jgi:hypothetical protein
MLSSRRTLSAEQPLKTAPAFGRSLTNDSDTSDPGELHGPRSAIVGSYAAAYPGQALPVTDHTPISPNAPAGLSNAMSNEAAGVSGTFQLRVLEGVIRDCLQDFFDEIRADTQNLHLELLRQFYIQRVSVYVF